MSFITSEYTVLTKVGEESIVIKPNVEFDGYLGGYTVTAYATIKDAETGEVVDILKPGAITTELKGRARKQDFNDLTVKELKELCISEGYSYASKATKASLIDLLEG